jgi:hypothetical protein
MISIEMKLHSFHCSSDWCSWKNAEIHTSISVAPYGSFRLYLYIVAFVIGTKSIISDIISYQQPVTCASYISRPR